MKRVIRLFLLVSGLSFRAAMPQHTTPLKKAAAAPASTHPETLNPSTLHTDTLNYGEDLKRIYVGDFEHLSFKQDSQELSLIVTTYMTQYSYSCAQYLPKDRVEIMTTECSREEYSVTPYGAERAGSRHCVAERLVGTGRYADPQVHALSEKLSAGMARGMLGDMLQGMQKNGDYTNGMKKMTDVITYVKEDMGHFLQENACVSAATVRWQTNLLRLGRNEEPVRMVGAAEAVPSRVLLAKGQDYKRLVDELIESESHAWLFNRYHMGNVKITAVQHDRLGVPQEVDAGYASGSVRVTFASDLPDCLYFIDAPTTCRAPNPKIVSQYKRNLYADANAPAYPETVPPTPAPSSESRFGGISTSSAVGPAASNLPESVLARQTAMRAAVPSGMSVQTLDVISEANANAGSTFRARLMRPLVLKHTQLPTGATVYLQVLLSRRVSGAAAYFDMYEVSVSKVETNGQIIAVASEPVRLTRHSMTSLDSRMGRDPTAIAVGTPFTFSFKEVDTP